MFVRNVMVADLLPRKVVESASVEVADVVDSQFEQIASTKTKLQKKPKNAPVPKLGHVSDDDFEKG